MSNDKTNMGEWKAYNPLFDGHPPLGVPYVFKMPFYAIRGLIRFAIKAPKWLWRSLVWYLKTFKLPLIVFAAIPLLLGMINASLMEAYIELWRRGWSMITKLGPSWTSEIPLLFVIASLLVALLKNYPYEPRDKGLTDGRR